MINIDASSSFNLSVTGADISVLIAGLGELPHKISAPLESKLVDQIQKQLDKDGSVGTA